MLCAVLFEAGYVWGCPRRQPLPLEGSRWLGCWVVGDAFLQRVLWSGSAKFLRTPLIHRHPYRTNQAWESYWSIDRDIPTGRDRQVILLIYWRFQSGYVWDPPPPPGGFEFQTILAKIKGVFLAFEYCHTPPDASIAGRVLYREYIRFLQRETLRNEWIGAKEFLLWTKVTRHKSERHKLTLGKVVECLDTVWPSHSGHSRGKANEAIMQRTVDICKPFFNCSDTVNPDLYQSLRYFDRFMGTDVRFAKRTGYDASMALQNIAVKCLDRISPELFEGVDPSKSAPEAVESNASWLIDQLKGDFFCTVFSHILVLPFSRHRKLWVQSRIIPSRPSDVVKV